MLSATAPCKFGGRAGPGNYTDVPAGQLSQRHIADLHIFPNQLCAAILTGEQVLEWLEMSASLFNQITSGSSGTALVNPDIPGHDFDVIHGLTCQFDITRPARFHPDGSPNYPQSRRVVHATHDNRPVLPGDRFVVAMNSYRAGGGGSVAALQHVKRLSLPQMSLRNVIYDYVSGRLKRHDLENAPPPWQFTPQPGTKVTVLTGPGATAHLGELQGRRVVSDGITKTGFLRLILPL